MYIYLGVFHSFRYISRRDRWNPSVLGPIQHNTFIPFRIRMLDFFPIFHVALISHFNKWLLYLKGNKIIYIHSFLKYVNIICRYPDSVISDIGSCCDRICSCESLTSRYSCRVLLSYCFSCLFLIIDITFCNNEWLLFFFSNQRIEFVYIDIL